MEMQDSEETGTSIGDDSGIVMSQNYTTKLDGSIIDLVSSEDGGDLIPTDIPEDGTELGDVELTFEDSVNIEGEMIEDTDIAGEVIDSTDITGEVIEADDVVGEVIEGEALEGEIIEEVIEQPLMEEEPLTPGTDASGTTKSLTDSGRVTPLSQCADSVTFSSSEKSTPIRKPRSSEPRSRKIDYDSMSSSSGSVKGGQFPQRHGIHWRKGEKLEAMDYLNCWFPAKIRAINEEEMQVLIHFDGWNQRYDEWIDMMSDKIRPLVRHSGRKERKKPAKGVRGRRPGGHSSKATTIPLNIPYLNDLKVGDAVYAKWTDCKMYPAKITNIMPTGSYEVIFYDGFKKLVQPINIRPMPNEYKSFEIEPVPEVVLKKAKMKLDHTEPSMTLGEESVSQERARSEVRRDSSAEKEPKVKTTKKRKLVVPTLFADQAIVGLGEAAVPPEGDIKLEPVSTQTEYTEHKTEELPCEIKEEPGISTATVPSVAGTSSQTPVTGSLPPKAFVVESDHNQYKCPYEGCPKGFRKEHLLDYHIKYYHINGGGPPPPPAKRRRKTTSTCSTESDSIGGSRKSKKNRNLSAEGGIYPVDIKLEYPDTPQSYTETGEISTQTAVDIGEDSNLDVLKQDSVEESSVTDAEDFLKPDELVNCICDFQEENGLMIQCEVCMCWQHAACFGITENTLPKTYVCFVCENPPGVRESARYIHEQDWFKTGEIPSFSFLPLPPMSEEKCNTVKSTHTLVTEIHQLNAVLHSLKLQLKILRNRDEAKLKQWRVDWDAMEADTLETCPVRDDKNEKEIKPEIGELIPEMGEYKPQLGNLEVKPQLGNLEVKPQLGNLEVKSEPLESTTDIKTEETGEKENVLHGIKQEQKSEEMNQNVDMKPIDLRANQDGDQNLQDPSGLNDDKKKETSNEDSTSASRSIADDGDKIIEIKMELDTDDDKIDNSEETENNKIKGPSEEACEGSQGTIKLNGDMEQADMVLSEGQGLTDVNDEKMDVKLNLHGDEENHSDSTESVVEDSIEVCERNLLNYIVRVQGEISDRFDKIEEQIEMLEAMEAMQSRREQPTSENVLNDMPQLKRSIRNMQDDLFKVKKMSVFH